MTKLGLIKQSGKQAKADSGEKEEKYGTHCRSWSSRGPDHSKRTETFKTGGHCYLCRFLVNPGLLKRQNREAMIYDSAKMTLEQVMEVIEQAWKEHKEVVRLHTGDPCLYGAIREQMDAMDKLGITYDICPGVSSFCGTAAALQMEYTLPGISQSVIITRMAGGTPVPERRASASLLLTRQRW